MTPEYWLINNDNSGIQGANIVNSTVGNIHITQNSKVHHQIDISENFVLYKKWISEEAHLIVRKKLKQLDIEGKHCKIKRKLKGSEGEFPEDELLNRIPHSVTAW